MMSNDSFFNFEKWPYRLRRLPHEERGNYSIATLITALIFVVLVNLVANIGHITYTKVETQNAADAVAQATSLEQARALNSITAANHLTGEMTALVVLHHTLGGYELEGEVDPPRNLGWNLGSRLPPESRTRGGETERRKRQSRQTDTAVEIAHFLAEQPFFWGFWTKNPPHKGARLLQKAQDTDDIGGMIYAARTDLKIYLTVTYGTHAAAGAMQWFPKTYKAGVALAWLMVQTEKQIERELDYLKNLEQLARDAIKQKRHIEQKTILELQNYAYAVAREFDDRVEQILEVIGTETFTETATYPPITDSLISLPGRLSLPVEAEQYPQNLGFETTQLGRSSFPWIAAWRPRITGSVPLLGGGGISDALSMSVRLFFGRGDHHFRYYSEEFALKKGIDIWVQLEKKERLMLVLNDAFRNGQLDKGREPWRESSHSRLADSRFAVLGFAHREPLLFSDFLFRNPHDDGITTFAQGFVYNANPRVVLATGQKRQPIVGFDTLNWNQAGVVQGPEGRLRRLTNGYIWQRYRDRYGSDVPEIQLNWQTKLVPSTRIYEPRVRTMTGWAGKTADKISILSPMANTH